MNIKSLTNKIVMGVLAGGIMVSTGILSFTQATAKAASSSTSTVIQQSKMDKVSPGENIKVSLDILLSAGNLTQDQQTKILDYMNQKGAERKAEMDKVKNMNDIGALKN